MHEPGRKSDAGRPAAALRRAEPEPRTARRRGPLTSGPDPGCGSRSRVSRRDLRAQGEVFGDGRSRRRSRDAGASRGAPGAGRARASASSAPRRRRPRSTRAWPAAGSPSPSRGSVTSRPGPNPSRDPDLSFPRSEAGGTPDADEPTAEHPDSWMPSPDAAPGETDEPAASPSRSTSPPRPTGPAALDRARDRRGPGDPRRRGGRAERRGTGGAALPQRRLRLGRRRARDVPASLGAEPEDALPLSVHELPPEDDDVAFDREVAARRVRTEPAGGPPAEVRPRPSRDGDELGRRVGSPRHARARRHRRSAWPRSRSLCLNAGTDATMVLATAIVVRVHVRALLRAAHAVASGPRP